MSWVGVNEVYVAMAKTRSATGLVAIIYILLSRSGLGAAPPSVVQVLDKWQSSYQWMKCVSMSFQTKLEDHVSDVSLLESDPNLNGHSTDTFQFARDGDRLSLKGELVFYRAGADKPLVTRQEIVTCAEGQIDCNYQGHIPRSANFLSQPKERDKELAFTPQFEGPLNSQQIGNSGLSLIEIIRGCSDAHCTDLGAVPGVGDDCVLIEASSEYGQIKVWLDARRGYNLVQYEQDRKAHDRYDLQPVDHLSFRPDPGWSAVEFHSSLRHVELQLIDGQSIPRSGVYRSRLIFQNGQTSDYNATYSRSDIKLNPDFSASHSFDIDLPDGTPIALDPPDGSGVRHELRSGRVVKAIDADAVAGLNTAVAQVESGPGAPKSDQTGWGRSIAENYTFLIIIGSTAVLVGAALAARRRYLGGEIND